MYDRKAYGRNLRPYYSENYSQKAYGGIFLLQYITIRVLSAEIGSYSQNMADIVAVRAYFGRKEGLRP